MVAVASSRSDQLLQPDVLASLSSLELIARAAVNGFLVGLHRSPYFGFSQEFAEYRPYAEGDDPRFIDWNVYSRTDRTYIKRFLGETNSHLMVLLDASASMAFASEGMLSKFRYGQMLAASLAYLAAHQHDAVGAMVFSDEVREFRPPFARSGQLNAVLHLIDQAQPERSTNLAVPFTKFRDQVRRRGLVAVISDFYCDPQTMLDAVRPLAFQGQDVILFHVLDPQELDPTFNESVLLEDMETGQTVEVAPQDMREQYPARIQAHIQQLRETAAKAGIDYVLLNTSESLVVPLRNYFMFRQKRR